MRNSGGYDPILSLPIRPANLFFHAIGLQTTLPCSNPDYSTLRLLNGSQVRTNIANNPNTIVSVVANDQLFAAQRGNTRLLTELYGTNVFRITNNEIMDILNSQRIYTSPLLPLPVYQALKKAMIMDNIQSLSMNNHEFGSYTLRSVLEEAVLEGNISPTHIRQLLTNINTYPEHYGLTNPQKDLLFASTFFQLGAMVVQTEKFHILIDTNGRILAREPQAQDDILLINLCGIKRGNSLTTAYTDYDQTIMKNTFMTALIAAQHSRKGILVIPAVGMGVWHGHPLRYWSALLDAIANGPDTFTAIFVNPNHEWCENCTGQEFGGLLNQYKTRLRDSPSSPQTQQKLRNLEKICNLRNTDGTGTDIVHFAYYLARTCADIGVALVNASGPNCTLGNIKGEKINHISYGNATEENFYSISLSGICYEYMTRIHRDAENTFHITHNGTLEHAIAPTLTEQEHNRLVRLSEQIPSYLLVSYDGLGNALGPALSNASGSTSSASASLVT